MYAYVCVCVCVCVCTKVVLKVLQHSFLFLVIHDIIL